MPYSLFEYQLLGQPVEQPCYYDVRLFGNTLMIRIYHMICSNILRHHVVNEVATCIAVLCSHGKSSSYIPATKC